MPDTEQIDGGQDSRNKTPNLHGPQQEQAIGGNKPELALAFRDRCSPRVNIMQRTKNAFRVRAVHMPLREKDSG